MASNALIKDVLRYDASTGDFFWTVSRHNSVRAGQKAGSPTRFGYVSIVINRKRYYAHRLAWLFAHGCWPSNCIDHIDGDKANNALSNLRDVPHRMNMQNVNHPSRNNTSGYRGVSLKRDRWRASICVDGRQVSLGSFDTALDAHNAYTKAKQALHEGATA